MRCTVLLLVLVAGLPLACLAGQGEPAAVFTVGDDVVCPQVRRFGLNLGDDIWYAGAALTKERIQHGGFEGVLYRQITFGPGGGKDFADDWFQADAWGPILAGAAATFVTGPRKWRPAKVLALGVARQPGRPDLPRYVLDTPGPAPQSGDGLLLEREQRDLGYVGQHGGAWWVFTSGSGTVESACEPTAGCAARLRVPGQGGAGIAAPALDARLASAGGAWVLSFRVRGAGRLTAWAGGLDKRGSQAFRAWPVAPSAGWREQRVEFSVEGFPPGPFCAGFEAEAGDWQVDDVSLVRLGDVNPTAFRDPVLAALDRFKPGVLRHLQIGGSSLRNILAPRFSRLAFSSSRGDPPPQGPLWPGHPAENGRARVHSYGLHEFLELCAAVGAAPWYCVPGTFTPAEMAGLVEYLAGPPDSPYGRVRAALGRAEPWTAAFGSLFLEIGNEAWNESYPFLLGGYSRQGGYWQDLFAAAKASPYFSPKLRLVAGGQAVNPERNRDLAAAVPAADLLAVAPYLVHELDMAQAARGDVSLFGHVFAYAWKHAETGFMARNHRMVARELAAYEVNYHITGGNAPAGPRNRVVAGLAGGVCLADWMLGMVARQGVRTQCFFTLAQLEQPLAGGGAVRLWGGAADLEPGRERFRPTFLAVALANRMLRGDMVRVAASGPLPTGSGLAEAGDRAATEFPWLRAYACREGGWRGLALVNLHLARALPVEVRFTGASGPARRATLAGPSPGAGNEPGGPEEVRVEEKTLDRLSSGDRLDLPPHSLTVLTWGGD